MKKYRDAAKVQKVIDSCITYEQALVARKMADNYSKMYNEHLNLAWGAYYRALESGKL